MAEIKQLSSHVANLIAAGEVVERPASVVKELVENAVDAGARSVTVEISNGGMSLIRVADNGCGIPDGESETAFLRHATSKISEERDLEAIGTLGFRGEALAAIAAVSRVELLTRTAGETAGTSLVLEGGKVLSHEEAGCPVGTTFVVRNLFYNTPARLKFMKQDAAEGAAVSAVCQKAALSHPEVAVKFIRDGKQDLNTPGDGSVKSAVYAVLGRDTALGFTEVKSSGEDMEITGFVSLPVCCRGSRSCQYFFVNGRPVKSATMMAALEEAYRNQKMVGRFPGCVLYLTTRLGSVDVNVHPTKTEVKFANDQRVFRTVYHGVLAALEESSGRKPVQPVLPTVKGDASKIVQTAFRMVAGSERREDKLPLNDSAKPRFEGGRPAVSTANAPVFSPGPVKPAYVPSVPTGHKPEPAPQASPIRPSEAIPGGAKNGQGDNPIPARQGEPADAEEPRIVPQEPDWVIRGELFHTYIMVEQGDRVLLIDKHAAHERMNFDRLKQAGYTPMVQSLLVPVTFTPSPEERQALLSRLPLLEEFGFSVEEFGARALIVRQCPGDLDAGEVENTLQELATRLVTVGVANPADARDELLHTIACKAAVKGGWTTAEEEQRAIAEEVLSGNVKYCPHGRPVSIEMTRAQLEKQFKRS